jgi:hypothetical protein
MNIEHQTPTARLTPEQFWVMFGPRILVHPITGCWLWQGAKEAHGYGHAVSGGRTIKLHRLSLEVHRPGELTDERPCALHNCPGGDRPNCINPRHLRAGTHAENMADMVAKDRAATGNRHGSQTMPERLSRGEDHYGAKLTEDQVHEIRRRRALGESQRALARMYGVSGSTIWLVTHGRTWAHVREPEAVA